MEEKSVKQSQKGTKKEKGRKGTDPSRKKKKKTSLLKKGNGPEKSKDKEKPTIQVRQRKKTTRMRKTCLLS